MVKGFCGCMSNGQQPQMQHCHQRKLRRSWPGFPHDICGQSQNDLLKIQRQCYFPPLFSATAAFKAGVEIKPTTRQMRVNSCFGR